MQKVCNKCLIEKDFSEFSLVKPGNGDKNNLSSRCKPCRAARNLELYHANKDKAKLQRQSYYAKNREKERLQALNWRTVNKDRHSENYKKWALENRARLTFKQSMRTKKVRLATPKTLNESHLMEMANFYKQARALSVQTGVQHHVDHIIPLKGANFSGLNVPWNMQILSAFDNVSKKNKVPADHRHLIWEHL